MTSAREAAGGRAPAEPQLGEIVLRQATADDAATVAACVKAAYAHYVPRMGQEPAPMLADYDALIAAGDVHLAEIEGETAGAIVLYARPDHLFVENVAVAPGFQGRGLGRRLMAFAEDFAKAGGLPAIRLYTNVHMAENLPFYASLGYVETERVHEEGYDRIYFEKRLD